jgi:hypothetical protein
MDSLYYNTDGPKKQVFFNPPLEISREKSRKCLKTQGFSTLLPANEKNEKNFKKISKNY